MSSILDKIVATKRDEIGAAKALKTKEELIAACELVPPPHDFIGKLTSGTGVGLIAEVKKASPSKGVIREDFSPVEIAKSYAQSGANCISVLTDEHYFQGSLDFLTAIRQTTDLPLLRKDFILDPYQVYEARAAGADAVLLIAECLHPEELQELHHLVGQMGMTALVELYDEANLECVLRCQPKLIGVNNRDLKTFEVDLHHSIRLRQQIPTDIVMVSESGIFTSADVKLLEQAGIDAMLVGESLMRADDISSAVRELLD